MVPFLAVLLVVFGVPSVVWPYELARVSEQLDSVGSTRRWEDVEPAGWKVTLTRVSGAAMVAVGLVLAGLNL
jgi:hypothetical protein